MKTTHQEIKENDKRGMKQIDCCTRIAKELRLSRIKIAATGEETKRGKDRRDESLKFGWPRCIIYSLRQVRWVKATRWLKWQKTWTKKFRICEGSRWQTLRSPIRSWSGDPDNDGDKRAVLCEVQCTTVNWATDEVRAGCATGFKRKEPQRCKDARSGV